MDPAPAPRQSAPDPVQAALLVLAVMGLILMAGQYLQSIDLIGGLLATEWGMVALPVLLLVWLGRMDPVAVLSLRRAPWRAWVGALAAGLSGWFLVGMLVEGLQQRFMPMPKELMEQLTRALFSQQRPLALDLLALALSPAICEELLFRGVLLRASQTVLRTPALLLLNGVMFGIFHLSIYRFFPTMALGMVLTLIVVRSRSILPAMLFHLLNNTCALLAGRYLGLAEGADVPLPLLWLSLAAVLFAGGMWLVTRPVPAEGGAKPSEHGA